MTAFEQLSAHLNAMPPDVREAEAQRILNDLRARMEGRPAELPELEPVPYERIAHLSGIVAGAPSDLAGNKRYLERLGERSTR